ncbi:MAG TPA: hypothetical protein VLH59_12510 [Ignavibacteriaceae bacterium]|nr:hypothetical protein [Ignavibacteriaceae bacterium]
MKYLLFVLLLTGFLLASIYAEENTLTKSTTSSAQTTQPPAAESKWYYGGNIGFSFWNDYFYLGVYPLVGYKVTPKLSLGAKIGYAYVSDDRYEPFPALNTSNYGASIFSRYRIIPQLYAHAEFAYWSYENISSFNTVNNTYNTERYWVPYLLLGGGYSQNIGPNVWLFAEVLFDVINDENSPYESGEPFISFGAGVGF